LKKGFNPHHACKTKTPVPPPFAKYALAPVLNLISEFMANSFLDILPEKMF
jgi:hypothetical protein